MHHRWGTCALLLILAQCPAAAVDLTMLGHTTIATVAARRVKPETVPAAHYKFEESSTVAQVPYFSPNLDGFAIPNESRCLGESILAMRWYQDVVFPLASGARTRITPTQFTALWNGRLDWTLETPISRDNLDEHRLFGWTHDKTTERSRRAIAALADIYQDYTSSPQTQLRSSSQFLSTTVDYLHDNKVPMQLTFGHSEGKDGGWHSVLVYKVVEGTAIHPQTGERTKAHKTCIWDPNYPAGFAGDTTYERTDTDERYQALVYFVVFSGAHPFIGVSEPLERSYYWVLNNQAVRPDYLWIRLQLHRDARRHRL